MSATILWGPRASDAEAIRASWPIAIAPVRGVGRSGVRSAAEDVSRRAAHVLIHAVRAGADVRRDRRYARRSPWPYVVEVEVRHLPAQIELPPLADTQRRRAYRGNVGDRRWARTGARGRRPRSTPWPAAAIGKFAS